MPNFHHTYPHPFNNPAQPGSCYRFPFEKAFPVRYRLGSGTESCRNKVPAHPFQNGARVFQGGLVGVADILQHIDQEIAQLQKARALLSAGIDKPVKTSGKTAAGKSRKKRRLTPEGRKRIAEAVKRRWERQKRAASTK
jgi:hypothetical protein